MKEKKCQKVKNCDIMFSSVGLPCKGYNTKKNPLNNNNLIRNNDICSFSQIRNQTIDNNR